LYVRPNMSEKGDQKLPFVITVGPKDAKSTKSRLS
jgi:hypothetical protein